MALEMGNLAMDPRALAATGAEALRRGDARTAREALERIASLGQADAGIYLAIAHACRLQKDHVAAYAAVENVLALEPFNVRALIQKADHLAALGDARVASVFYQTALNAAPPLHELPPDLREDLERAKAMCNEYAAQFEAFLRRRLVAKGFESPRSSTRFRQSFDILLGKKKIYFQQPRTFYFPELPQIQFYDNRHFPWIPKVEAATGDIRAEVVELMKESSVFKPYVEGDSRQPGKDESGLAGNPDWSAYYLIRDGEIVHENVARCPKTIAALADVPHTSMKGRSPSVLFSLLRPGARIPPHTGLVNTRLICHLPLLVPPDCALRVGNETRVPVEGKVWVFDDTMEHEAWNLSDRPRVILLFEVWRPELTDEERVLVSTMFEAIDAQSGKKPEWGI